MIKEDVDMGHDYYDYTENYNLIKEKIIPMMGKLLVK